MSLEQIAQLRQIATKINSLWEHPGWLDLVKVVEGEIAMVTPSAKYIDSTEQAIKNASKLCYVAGLKRVIDIVKGQMETLKELNVREAEVRGLDDGLGNTAIE